MKRKRGNKKGKSKRPLVNKAVPNVTSIITEDSPGVDDMDNGDFESGMEADAPSSVVNDQQEKVSTVNSGRLVDKAAGRLVYGRVRVKIKTSKPLDSQRTSSDAPTLSDTDKSSQQVGPEKEVVANEKMEDCANSLPEVNFGLSSNASKKTGSIKIKSSRAFNSPSINPCSNSGLVKGEKMYQKESELLHRDRRYSQQELNAALEVIIKIMKMDAAEPFNVPVNPIALGIPDYFDVIDTPMDFGTIRSNLENGVKYMNSEDVFKDVRYIWDNCYKYNNKGDYILELMKRVKKNFTKYWTAAGLYTEQLQGINVVESIEAKDATYGTMPAKGAHSKFKTRKRHGVKRHKEDCLCAICIMMRRRQEREENAQIAEEQIGTYEDHPDKEAKTEATSPVESPSGDDTSSNKDNLPGSDADADLEERGEELKLEDNGQHLYSPLQEKEEGQENEITFLTREEGEISEHSLSGDKSGEDHNEQHQTPTSQSGGDIQNETQKEELSLRHQVEAVDVKQQKPKELLEKSQKAKIFENLRHLENPMFLRLCGTLFADNHQSLWSGPHSLVRHKGATGKSSIHAAVQTFMK